MSRSICCDGKIKKLRNGWTQCGACGQILNDNTVKLKRVTGFPRPIAPIKLAPRATSSTRGNIRPKQLTDSHDFPQKEIIISPATLANKRVISSPNAKRIKVPETPKIKRI